MKPGELIYRVIRSKYDDKWYYCVYEVIRYRYFDNTSNVLIQIAPIITYYDAKHSSHSTVIFHSSEDWESVWRNSWDFISKDEFAAKEAYKQKTENENQDNDKDASISRN